MNNNIIIVIVVVFVVIQLQKLKFDFVIFYIIFEICDTYININRHKHCSLVFFLKTKRKIDSR